MSDLIKSVIARFVPSRASLYRTFIPILKIVPLVGLFSWVFVFLFRGSRVTTGEQAITPGDSCLVRPLGEFRRLLQRRELLLNRQKRQDA